MWVPNKIIAMIKAGDPVNLIVTEIRAHLLETYSEPNIPTVNEFVRANWKHFRRWANPDPSEVIQATILSKSPNPVVAAKYTAKLAAFRDRYELIEEHFGPYEE